MNLKKTAKLFFGSKLEQYLKETQKLVHELREKIYDLHILFINSNEFPDELRKIPKPPLVLFLKGPVDYLKLKKIAIVGTRRPSIFTVEFLQWIITKFPKQIITVSGFARGCDHIVHKNSLYHGTIAVLPHSLDFISSSQFLKEYNNQRILFITEYVKTISIQKYFYVHRNRIIAGLANSILIAEAGKKSGALITAEYAIKYNKKILGLNHYLQKNNKGLADLLKKGSVCDITKLIDIQIYREIKDITPSLHQKDLKYIGNGYYLGFKDINFFREFLSLD